MVKLLIYDLTEFIGKSRPDLWFEPTIRPFPGIPLAPAVANGITGPLVAEEKRGISGTTATNGCKTWLTCSRFSAGHVQ